MCTLKQFTEQFPDEDACLEYLVKRRFPRKKLKRVKGRKAFYDAQGRWYFPLKGTIFEDSQTSLLKWFYAVYLFSVSKNGVSGAELRRHLGVTEKCAWRIGSKIRSAMKDESGKLCGIVEADECYLGKRRTKTQVVLLGALERKGRVRVQVTDNRREESVLPFLDKNVRRGSRLMTDEAAVYKIARRDYKHKYVTHAKYQWVRGDVHTNGIEGFWSQFKRSMRGTYHRVSRRHLQSYVDQFVFYRNHRGKVFETLLERL